jgi:hypothetical protein
MLPGYVHPLSRCIEMGLFTIALSRPRTFKAVSQLLWSHKGREEWFSLGENHEEACRFPDFLQRGTR